MDDLLQQAEALLDELITPQGDVLGLAIQALLFGLALLITPLIYRFSGRYFDKLVARLGQYDRVQSMPAYSEGFATWRSVLRPLVVWLLMRLGVVVLDQLDRPSSLLLWLSGYFLIWLLYRLAHAIMTLWMSLDTAERITNRIIRPIAIIIALVHTSGLLDEFLSLGFTIQTARITLGAAIAGLAVFVLGLVASRASRSWLQTSFLPNAGMDDSLSAVLATLASYVLLVAGLFAALIVAGFDLTGLTVILGGLSVGLAFGLQDVIANFVSGFILLFERSVAHGDVIGVEDEFGVVQDVGIRATVVRTIKDVELIVPNSSLLTNVVTNYSRGENRVIRMEITVYTYYDRSPKLVREAMLTAAGRVNGLAEKPAPYVEFQAFGADRTNEFTLEVWIDDIGEFDEISSNLRFYIWEEMDARGLHFPPMQHEVAMRDGQAS
jgi:small-conductance mechanosensitive channel